jgi:hypothetical protein
MYPIAWATVEGENYDSWYWFLSLLQKDIQINNQGLLHGLACTLLELSNKALCPTN